MEKPAKQPKDRNDGMHRILKHCKWKEGKKEGSKDTSKARNCEKMKDGIKQTQHSQSTFFPAPPKHAERSPLSLTEKSEP